MVVMKAAYIEDLCAASGIRYGDLPDPVPDAPGQVLVRVEAVAVNKVDSLVRSGAWQTPVQFPLAVGRDLVGTVAAGGAGPRGAGQGWRVAGPTVPDQALIWPARSLTVKPSSPWMSATSIPS